jgi:hypothetical protein
MRSRCGPWQTRTAVGCRTTLAIATKIESFLCAQCFMPCVSRPSNAPHWIAPAIWTHAGSLQPPAQCGRGALAPFAVHGREMECTQRAAPRLLASPWTQPRRSTLGAIGKLAGQSSPSLLAQERQAGLRAAAPWLRSQGAATQGLSVRHAFLGGPHILRTANPNAAATAPLAESRADLGCVAAVPRRRLDGWRPDQLLDQVLPAGPSTHGLNASPGRACCNSARPWRGWGEDPRQPMRTRRTQTACKEPLTSNFQPGRARLAERLHCRRAQPRGPVGSQRLGQPPIDSACPLPGSRPRVTAS